MDLREVLAAVCDEMYVDAILARLSQPDVLAEFERRCASRFGFIPSLGPVGRQVATRARAALASLLDVAP